MRGRRIGIGALLVLGTLFWTFFGIGLWAQRQALDTDEWVDTSTELLENEEIRTALGVYLVDQLYQSADVQDRIEEALPPRLDRLAAPAAAGLKELARRNAPRLLGSAVAIKAWSDANRAGPRPAAGGDRRGRGRRGAQARRAPGPGGGRHRPAAEIADRLPPEHRQPSGGERGRAGQRTCAPSICSRRSPGCCWCWRSCASPARSRCRATAGAR